MTRVGVGLVLPMLGTSMDFSHLDLQHRRMGLGQLAVGNIGGISQDMAAGMDGMEMSMV
jgi:hypothetical protein